MELCHHPETYPLAGATCYLLVWSLQAQPQRGGGEGKEIPSALRWAQARWGRLLWGWQAPKQKVLRHTEPAASLPPTSAPAALPLSVKWSLENLPYEVVLKIKKQMYIKHLEQCLAYSKHYLCFSLCYYLYSVMFTQRFDYTVSNIKEICSFLKYLYL